MELSTEKKNEYVKRLLMSRMRILLKHGFYGLLLMHMIFALDESCKSTATDGRRIYFSPKFLDELSDNELDYVLMHEILHVVLGHCERQGKRDKEQFDMACDIVVNSNILLASNMDLSSITLKNYGTQDHTTPNGTEGNKYTVEQAYDILTSVNKESKQNTLKEDMSHSWDDHTKWKTEDKSLLEEWAWRIKDACEIISKGDPSNANGGIPLCMERKLADLRKSQIDWRTILNNFVQEEVVDYSFTPPDKRFEDCPFFLPDFNEKTDVVNNILFMIDTSGSMMDEMVAAAYSEIKGAIDQFSGRLKGWLGFFDTKVFEPKPFGSVTDLKKIKPIGNGGTNFYVIFEYVQNFMQDNIPSSIIILTDGYADFPDEKLACGIPVLWLLNNEEVIPPWGKTARIKI